MTTAAAVTSAGGNVGTPAGPAMLAEPEKDANYYINELNKGINHPSVGEKCQAILGFPALVEKFPFPAVINSLFMKMIEVFRDGNNLLRVCVLRVCAACSRHLEADKVTGVEQIVKTLIGMSHSTDPTARALAVRLLATLAGLTAHHPSVHQVVANALDSHFGVELRSAVWAMDRLVPQSSRLAATLTERLCRMLEELGTEPQLKLRLVHAARHFHKDAATLEMVRSRLLQLVEAHPTSDMLVALLDTLTRLAARAPPHAAAHVDLLLRLLEESRTPVLEAVLRGLRTLLSDVPHHWTTAQTELLVESTNQVWAAGRSGLAAQQMQVLCQLADTGLASGLSKMSDLARRASSARKPVQLVAVGLHLLTALALFAGKDAPGSDVTSEEAATAIMAFLADARDCCSDVDSLKRVLMCIKTLLVQWPCLVDLLTDSELVLSLLRVSNQPDGNPKSTRCLLEFLCGVEPPPKVNSTHLVKLLAEINDPDLGQLLATLVLRLQHLRPMDSETQWHLLCYAERVSAWYAYRLGRSAARFGQHRLAARLFQSLEDCAAAEPHVYWLRGLCEFCSGEAELMCLQQEVGSVTTGLQAVQMARAHLQRAVTALAAGWSVETSDNQAECYVTSRLVLLGALEELLAVAGHCQIPRAGESRLFAMSELETARARLEEAVTSLRQLQLACMDADVASLRHLELLQAHARLPMSLLTNLVDVFDSKVVGQPPLAEVARSQAADEYRELAESSWKELIRVRSAESGALTCDSLSLLRRVALKLLAAPLCLPRFLFQRLQTTGITLAVSPRSRSVNDPHCLAAAKSLVLSVEGVVTWRGNRCLRRVHRAEVEVSACSRTASATSATRRPLVLRELAPVRGDYFSAQLVLALPHPGVYQVDVRVRPVDGGSQRWSEHATEPLYVKVESALGGQTAGPITSSAPSAVVAT